MSIHHGQAFIDADGVDLHSKEDAELEMGGLEREEVMTVYGLEGFMEKQAPAVVTCTIPLSPNTPVDHIDNFVNGKITFRSDTGRKWIITNAFRSKTLSFGRDGMKVEFKGRAAEEI